MPIVNNYGVWIDEYRALGMEHTLECTFPDAVCYFGEGNEASAQPRAGRGLAVTSLARAEVWAVAVACVSVVAEVLGRGKRDAAGTRVGAETATMYDKDMLTT